ncbi:hypothetical protein JCM3774_006357, partial [Rhodotorula dairenensis]
MEENVIKRRERLQQHEDVFICIPQGYTHQISPGLVLKLDGAMYGTKQASREHRALEPLMTRLDRCRSTSDVCVFVKTAALSLVVIAIYVNNGLIAAESDKIIAAELKALNDAYKLKVLDPVSNFLSMQFDHLADGIFLHHSKYVKSILDCFGFVLLSRSNASTPMDERHGLDTSPPTSNVTLYQSPVVDDWQAVKRIFLYLANTVDFGIFYRRNSSVNIVAYSDASWANDLVTCRSVGGYAILVAGGVILWRLRQQNLVATSTTKSELLAASETTKEVISTCKLATDLEEPPSGPTIIFEDNQAAIAIALNPASHGRTKHFGVAQLFVRDRVALGDVALKYISTHDMVADSLTPGEECRSRLSRRH